MRARGSASPSGTGWTLACTSERSRPDGCYARTLSRGERMPQPGSEVGASGVDFDFTPEDALAFGVFTSRAAGGRSRVRNAAPALIFAPVATVVLVAYDFGWKGWTIVALGLFATLLLRPGQLFRRLPRRFRGHVHLELGDKGIRTVRD